MKHLFKIKRDEFNEPVYVCEQCRVRFYFMQFLKRGNEECPGYKKYAGQEDE